MPRRRRNPNGFTTDEIRTSDRIIDEGAFGCSRYTAKKDRIYRYFYPFVEVRMCDKEALEPVSRVFGRATHPARSKQILCKPEDFPPDGKGIWRVSAEARKAERIMQRLDPLLTTKTRKKWQQAQQKCRQRKW